jgi:hypothetical protein
MANLRATAETLASPMFDESRPEILYGQGFEKNLQQISIRPTFFNSYPQIVHNSIATGVWSGNRLHFGGHQRPEGNKPVSPLAPGILLEAGGEFDDELFIPQEVGGEVLCNIGRAFFLILIQQAVYSAAIEKACLNVTGDMFLLQPDKPLLLDIPPDLVSDIIDDHFISFKGSVT